jgi:hypothetical protein
MSLSRCKAQTQYKAQKLIRITSSPVIQNYWFQKNIIKLYNKREDYNLRNFSTHLSHRHFVTVNLFLIMTVEACSDDFHRKTAQPNLSKSHWFTRYLWGLCCTSLVFNVVFPFVYFVFCLDNSFLTVPRFKQFKFIQNPDIVCWIL